VLAIREPGPPVTTLFDADPKAALKHHFGFDAFRPLQEEIVATCWPGATSSPFCPRAAGKSLCFQLPAVMREGLTVVISPLIALMKDQVDGLSAAGVPATFLNSTLDAEEARRRLCGLHQGAYRLLYFAPERLGLASLMRDLAQWNVTRFAIDEAHCISEWGHDFRPEYRRLAELRRSVPGGPAARPHRNGNGSRAPRHRRLARAARSRRLRGEFQPAQPSVPRGAEAQHLSELLGFVRERGRESGIVYAASRRQAENLAEKLTEAGVPALPYHAGLESRERSYNQERFRRDDVSRDLRDDRVRHGHR
jgi:ATP-dependent DNA helicase RecQ